MADPAEASVELDTSVIQEDSHPPPKEAHDDDSGAGSGVKHWPGWPGETVFRMLVPAQKVGGLIGRKGEFIKKMCEESRARIKILDGPPGTLERALLLKNILKEKAPSVGLKRGTGIMICTVVKKMMGNSVARHANPAQVEDVVHPPAQTVENVMISAKEEPEATIPPAVDGLLRVHKHMVDGLDNDSGDAPSGGSVTTRLLVAAAQAGSLIGKQGASIKSIQDASKCIARVLGPEDLPVIALEDDRVVEIQGEPKGVHKAVELIASHLRKFLVDRSVLPLFEVRMSTLPNPQMEPNAHYPSWGHPQGFPNSGGNPQFMPPRQRDHYNHPPSELPPPDRQPYTGLPSFGRDVPLMGVHTPSNAQPPQSIITQVTQQMQIPLSYADAVIGTGGASISYIRRASGATITIQESRGTPGEMTVEINGTATQVQTAQQLIQNFMAEAAGGSQNPGGGIDQGYGSFLTNSSMYASPASNSGQAGHPGGPYASVCNGKTYAEKDMEEDGVKLFGMWPAPMSLRIEWALKLKGVDYEYVEEDHHTKSPLLLKYNPIYKKVPVLEHKGRPVLESLVILEYIDEVWKGDWMMMPHDPLERSTARFWAKFSDDKCLPAFKRVLSETGAAQEKALKEAKESLKTLEEALHGNKFFGGDSIGFLDIANGWLSYWIPLAEVVVGLKMVDENEMPSLHAWFEEFLRIPAINERLPPKDRLLGHLKHLRKELVASSSKV
ncbi:hypothetical protein ACLOJK_024961 [Asimina triloba]